MSTQILLIKNMVCHRCLLAVENILDHIAVAYQQLITGEIHLEEKLNSDKQAQLATQLSRIGLELMDPNEGGLVEKIKQLVIKKARNEVGEKEAKMKISAYIVHHLFHEYTYLSSLFSSAEGRTIESYFIKQRIEKVKELLVYNEMTLSAISYEMEYSSVAHLSYQFKQVTGLTPSHFKKLGNNKRAHLDQV